ncbi:PLP-dependent aminotransferase family protein [Gynuella sp.]|uniref:aminotransferase-like domain-containing protein n=1 Tax=Gynuella sp. TaxID=2969146 RepID=UPI003D0A4A9B
MTLYETLAHRVIDDIRQQRLPAGTRLPALRVMARQNNVSMTTATRTYDYLQQSGWIYALPQSGYYVASQVGNDHFPVPETLPMESRDPKRFAPGNGYNPQSDHFNPLGTSMLAPELQPGEALQRTIRRVARRSHLGLLRYPELQGELSLRTALARHFREDHFAFAPSELVITNGCLEAVRLAIESVTDKGDTVAVCSPCFSGLLDLLATLSRNIIEIPVTLDGIHLPMLEACMARGEITAALLSTTHINPLGTTLPVAQKQALAALAASYQIPIIEDDVYLELGHQQRHALPAKYWDRQGYMLWCGSMSKTLAPGLRLGWCLPGRYQQVYLERHGLTSLGVNALTQACVGEFIATGEYRTHLHKIRLRLQQQIHQYRQFLRQFLPAHANVSAPEGGLVVWIQIAGLDAVALEQTARQQNIDVRSGACFSTHAVYHDCLRINCGWPLQADQASGSTYWQLAELCRLISQQLSVSMPESVV